MAYPPHKFFYPHPPPMYFFHKCIKYVGTHCTFIIRIKILMIQPDSHQKLFLWLRSCDNIIYVLLEIPDRH